MFALALISLVQAEPLPTVFGLQLGAPVALPECERDPYYGYASIQPQNCDQKPDDPKKPENGRIYFVPSKMPEIVGYNVIPTAIIDGKLEGLYVQTLKYTVADGVIDELTRKFGTPTTREKEMASPDGIAFPSVHVTWVRPGYTVDYHSVGWHIDNGELFIETDRAKAQREERERAETSERTPL